jgi:prephenate dehydratase
MQNRKLRVAYQGAPGAFSESAIQQLLGDEAAAVPCTTFDALFNSINEGSAERILAPLENTLAGPVLRCYDLLHESSLHITAEVVIRISHCLIGCPGARVNQIRRVESHPVALAQCEKFFTAHPEIERVAGDDTADSVRRVLEGGDLTRAAIAGAQAAQRYGGQILLSEIEDDPGNFTRFALLSPKAEQAPDADATALAITIPNEAGSLFRALEPFAKNNVDLASLVSRPLKGTPWHYRFFFDLWAPLGDPRLTAALDMLKPRTVAIRIFGSYRSGKQASKQAEG